VNEHSESDEVLNPLPSDTVTYRVSIMSAMLIQVQIGIPCGPVHCAYPPLPDTTLAGLAAEEDDCLRDVKKRAALFRDRNLAPIAPRNNGESESGLDAFHACLKTVRRGRALAKEDRNLIPDLSLRTGSLHAVSRDFLLSGCSKQRNRINAQCPPDRRKRREHRREQKYNLRREQRLNIYRIHPPHPVPHQKP
jgi:hypothetical protein